ncbi:MAG: methyltransferase [Bacillales bacterium]|nr:methyltransferase [Bacillales bacterium]
MISFTMDGKTISLMSDNGVFSKNELDQGTEILIRSLLPLDLYGDILDLGCGIGTIGLTLAYLLPHVNLICVDVNTRALALAQENAKRLQISNRVRCLQSDVYSGVEGQFNYIVSNPPIRAGKKVTYAMYEGALEHLIDGGSLIIVIRKAQGALSAKAYLESIFSNVRILEKKKGFYVIQAIK